MILKWTAAWYELDQTIIVGDIDCFYLPKDENDRSFLCGFHIYQKGSSRQQKLEIVRITHPVLGEVKGIVAIGLDYTVYLADGKVLEINAEEHPGQIYNSSLVIDDWTFDVTVDTIDESYLPETQEKETPEEKHKRYNRYKALLGISDAPWAG